MKKILLAGAVGCGKTTLCQTINGLEQTYKKTQALEVVNGTIDTPGEYLERRSLLHALIVTSVEADLVVFVQDATAERFMFSPGAAGMFPVPVAGVVSKIDEATEAQKKQASELLTLAGAQPIFAVSAKSGDGMDAFFTFLDIPEKVSKT
ncbi:MAG: EutP/PduV family microcompartment system protein [Clostridiales bacterium]|nr:EutP/PduV family microcompartment system protein [Clostridiales bacterium]